ncbi:hypothetical protein LINPERPRIM_LOCUS5336 [Linum perenne]
MSLGVRLRMKEMLIQHLLEPVSRKEALKVASTLQNYLLQLEKTTPEILSALRKVHDELLLDLNFKKKQTIIHSYFSTLS